MQIEGPESLVSKLGHACKVMPPSKTFFRIIFELLKGTRQDHHHNRFNVVFRADECGGLSSVMTGMGSQCCRVFG